MTQEPFFRKEVILNKKTPYYGRVFINTPVNHIILTIGLTCLMILIICFFVFAQFSEKFIVKGYINSTKGIVTVYPNKIGIIKKNFVKLGQHVKLGEPMFLISTNKEGIYLDKNSDILSKLNQKILFFNKEIKYKKKELHNLKKLVNNHYLSKTDYHNKQQDLFVLQNEKKELEMEIIKYKNSQSHIVRAPISGIISSVMMHQGQHIIPTKPLAKLLPDKSKLIAELFVPVKNAGFLKKNTAIIIQYDAYPALKAYLLKMVGLA